MEWAGRGENVEEREQEYRRQAGERTYRREARQERSGRRLVKESTC